MLPVVNRIIWTNRIACFHCLAQQMDSAQFMMWIFLQREKKTHYLRDAFVDNHLGASVRALDLLDVAFDRHHRHLIGMIDGVPDAQTGFLSRGGGKGVEQERQQQRFV